MQHYLNEDTSIKLLDENQPGIGLSGKSVTVDDKNFSCTFRRENSDKVANYFDLNKDSNPFLLLAYGPMSNGKPEIHTFKYATTSRMDFKAAITTETTQDLTTTGEQTTKDESTTGAETTQSITTTEAKTTEAASTSVVITTTTESTTATTKSPVSISSFSSKLFNVTWSNPSNYSIEFNMRGKFTSGNYMAIGFSSDTKMVKNIWCYNLFLYYIQFYYWINLFKIKG